MALGYLPAQMCRTTAIHSNNVALKQIYTKNVAQELLAHIGGDSSSRTEPIKRAIMPIYVLMLMMLMMTYI